MLSPRRGASGRRKEGRGKRAEVRGGEFGVLNFYLPSCILSTYLPTVVLLLHELGRRRRSRREEEETIEGGAA